MRTDGYASSIAHRDILARVKFLWCDFAPAAAASKIVLGYASPGRALPFWLAQDMGLFSKYGVDVESLFIRGAPILVAALAAGDIQVGSTGGSATLAAVAGGQDLKSSPTSAAATTST